jgi:predicted transcriptional regulator
MSARAADVLTANPVAVRANASFKNIAVRLRELHVSAFPVLGTDDKAIGCCITPSGTRPSG